MNTHVVEDVSLETIVSPVEAITALLVEAGHPNPGAWLNGLDPVALVTPDHNLQRFLINRQWRFLICSNLRGTDTSNVRYCLIDDGSLADWLRVFKMGVLPCIMENQLPKSI